MNSPTAIIEWPSPTGNPPLAGHEIHVWAASLNVPDTALQNFSATLSPDELERANRFKFSKYRNRYISGRGALRVILAKYLGRDAPELQFHYLENGKPILAEDLARAGIHFNLAHTGDLALVGVTRIGRLGVDVESVRPIKNVDELVARFFSPRENVLFQKLPDGQKPEAFFNLWTRKEAMLKATGEGITRSLSLVEVSFLPGEPAQLLAIAGDSAARERWFLKEFIPAKDFTAAVAVERVTSNLQMGKAEEARELVVKCWKWELENG